MEQLEKKQDEVIALIKHDMDHINDKIEARENRHEDHDDRIEALETKVSALLNKKRMGT